MYHFLFLPTLVSVFLPSSLLSFAVCLAVVCDLVWLAALELRLVSYSSVQSSMKRFKLSLQLPYLLIENDVLCRLGLL